MPSFLILFSVKEAAMTLVQRLSRGVRRVHGGPVSMILLIALSTGACSGLVIEDWSRIPAATKGTPPGWRGQVMDTLAHAMSIVDDGNRNVLCLVSARDSWAITKDIKSDVEINKAPILEWSWKAITLPARGDSREEATDDYAARVCVGWLRFPAALRSRILCYVWDSTAPVGTIVRHKTAPTITLVVVRSGAAELGRWVNEQRNVADDFKRVYADSPDAPRMIVIAISSELTNSMAEACWGSIAFRGLASGRSGVRSE